MSPPDRTALLRILEAAAHGASADNGQPWRFAWRGGRLSILLDGARARSRFDEEGFAALLGLGSALENLVIAAGHLGYPARIAYAADREDRRGAATVEFGRADPVPHPLFEAIWARRTNRRPYARARLSAEDAAALRSSPAEAGPCRLLLVEEPEQLDLLARLTARADRIRFDFSQPDVHEDFFRCLRWTEAEARAAGDGIWVRSLEVGPVSLLALRLLADRGLAARAASLGAARLFARASARLLRRSAAAALVVLRSSEPLPPPAPLIEGGRQCQRLWLGATARGLACQPMAVLPLFFFQLAARGPAGFPGTSGLEVAALQRDFVRAFGLEPTERLLLAFRVGRAAPPSAPSFRRSLADSFTIEDDSLPLAGPTASA